MLDLLLALAADGGGTRELRQAQQWLARERLVLGALLAAAIRGARAKLDAPPRRSASWRQHKEASLGELAERLDRVGDEGIAALTERRAPQQAALFPMRTQPNARCFASKPDNSRRLWTRTCHDRDQSHTSNRHSQYR